MLYIVDFPPFIQLLYMFFVRINTIYIFSGMARNASLINLDDKVSMDDDLSDSIL